MEGRRFYTVGDIAEGRHVSRQAIHAWLVQGLIRPCGYLISHAGVARGITYLFTEQEYQRVVALEQKPAQQVHVEWDS